ncbi:glycoside hydrolase family 113 [Corynebacterium pacaense]|uniref:glycoside hydrolase family 113 n=1 Tax=Corynebacterium pacaense TaxID=1816684 RepID=UPI0011774EE4|nr:hypothetical protein [Corynebacterium pacaense]
MMTGTPLHRIGAAIGPVVLLCGLAACAQTPPSDSGSPVGGQTSSSRAPVEKQALWSQGQFQQGVQLYWHHNPEHFNAAETRVIADRQLDYIESLGANSLGVTVPIFVDGAYPSTVYADSAETPSVEELGVLLEAASERGFRVMLRPVIDEANIGAESPGAWRGTIQPQDVDAWFRSYQALLLDYVPLLEQYGVDEYVIGVELNSLEGYSDNWSALRAAITDAGYHGILSYSRNWDSGTSDVPFDQLGLDFYPDTDLADDSTSAQVTDKLLALLTEQPEALRKRTTVQEVGIAALDGAYARPSYWGDVPEPERFNSQVQANWFLGVCSAARQAEMEGVYYWMLDKYEDTPNPDPDTQLPKSFVARPGEDAIRTCFADTATGN